MIFFQALVEIWCVKFSVISREIRPIAALYHSPPKNNTLYTASTSSFTLDLRSQWLLGAVCLMYFYCITISLKKNIGGGYKAARGLIKKDIAKLCDLY